MKSTFLTIFGLAAAAVAQSSDDLPQCGQTCASNMVSAEKSEELGCDAGDIGCLCTNQDFIYGLRDCSSAICSGEQAALVVSYGLEICRRAGVQITTGASGSVSASATGSGAVRTVLSTLTDGDSTITSALSTISGTASGSNTEEVSVTTYTSVLTNSEGDEFTTTGEAILGGARLTTFTSGGSEIIQTIGSETETSSAESAEVTTFTSDGTEIVRTLVTETVSTDSTDSAASAEVTTFTTDGTKVVRTLTTETVSTGSESGSASETVTDASTETETEGSTDTATGTDAEATTTSSDNAAMAHMTGAPAGVIAAAGIAMLLL